MPCNVLTTEAQLGISSWMQRTTESGYIQKKLIQNLQDDHERYTEK